MGQNLHKPKVEAEAVIIASLQPAQTWLEPLKMVADHVFCCHTHNIATSSPTRLTSCFNKKNMWESLKYKGTQAPQALKKLTISWLVYQTAVWLLYNGFFSLESFLSEPSLVGIFL